MDLRGLAIIGVFLFHSQLKNTFIGGSIGVDLFFVLSGFLITTLLLQEWSLKGTISLSAFYVRRALRLMPALFVFVVIYAVVAISFADFAFTGRPDLTTVLVNAGYALSYMYNWAIILGAEFPRRFDHLWSLAVEEQFYLVWPFVLLLMVRRLKPELVLAITAAVAAGSASLPLLFPDLPYRTLYDGTHFRAHELLTGCVLAQLYVSGILTSRIAGSLIFRAASVGAMVYLVVVVFEMNSRAGFLYGGHYAQVAVASAIVIAATAFTGSGPVERAASWRPLVYLGKRSYALYLWHNPMLLWFSSLGLVEHLIVAAVFSLVAAELSYRLVEQPALRLKARISQGPQREAKWLPSLSLLGRRLGLRARPNAEPAPDLP